MKPLYRLIALALLGASTLASATPIFAGQWELYSRPASQGNSPPPVLSGQQAAAVLFGGSASDYLISTAGPDAADIDYLAWYDHFGFADTQAKHAQDYYSDLNGNGVYDGWSLGSSDASAMVMDHPYTGPGPYPFVNYAFRVQADSAVPEPLSVGLMGVGLLGLGLLRRRRR
jgi:hypothetical protein